MEKCVCMQCLLYEPVSDLQGPKRTFESCIYLEMKDVPVVTCDFLSQQSQVSWLISINTGHGLTSWIYQAWDICRVVQKCQQNICAKTHPKGRTLNASQNTTTTPHNWGNAFPTKFAMNILPPGAFNYSCAPGLPWFSTPKRWTWTPKTATACWMPLKPGRPVSVPGWSCGPEVVAFVALNVFAA